jgi:hypothetical protein
MILHVRIRLALILTYQSTLLVRLLMRTWLHGTYSDDCVCAHPAEARREAILAYFSRQSVLQLRYGTVSRTSSQEEAFNQRNSITSKQHMDIFDYRKASRTQSRPKVSQRKKNIRVHCAHVSPPASSKTTRRNAETSFSQQ